MTDQEQKLKVLEADVRAQLEAGDKRMKQIETDLKTNTEATERVEANTKEMLEFFNSMKGAFKTLEMLGKLAKPLGYILMVVGSVVGIVLTIKNGGATPTKP